MCCQWASHTGLRLGKLCVLSCLLASGGAFLGPPCRGDSPVPATPGRQAIAWTSGPAQASLGTIAGLQVPAGYRFADAKGARAFLQAMRSPVPQGLAGILAPVDSGSWWVVFKFAELGYVKD